LRRVRIKKNGPLFLSTLATINTHIQRLKYPPLPAELDSYADGPENGMLDRVKEWTDVPNKVAERIFEETYQRVVPPHYARLREYASFSSETYGEMLPPFVNRIIKETNLGPNDMLVDLGAGVGNVLIQAALQTGCDTCGVEIQKGAAEVCVEQQRAGMPITRLVYTLKMNNRQSPTVDLDVHIHG
ncbi:S-adenosyl-L-methionine-dependent methyltransferase, partial [Peniophora sp. CONT]